MTYIYKCNNGHRFPAVQSIKDAELKKCINCNASVKRVIQAVGFSLVGPGWGKDSYSKSPQRKVK